MIDVTKLERRRSYRICSRTIGFISVTWDGAYFESGKMTFWPDDVEEVRGPICWDALPLVTTATDTPNDREE